MRAISKPNAQKWDICCEKQELQELQNGIGISSFGSGTKLAPVAVIGSAKLRLSREAGVFPVRAEPHPEWWKTESRIQKIIGRSLARVNREPKFLRGQ
jgi:hypothetical protein